MGVFWLSAKLYLKTSCLKTVTGLDRVGRRNAGFNCMLRDGGLLLESVCNDCNTLGNEYVGEDEGRQHYEPADATEHTHAPPGQEKGTNDPQFYDQLTIFLVFVVLKSGCCVQCV